MERVKLSLLVSRLNASGDAKGLSMLTALMCLQRSNLVLTAVSGMYLGLMDLSRVPLKEKRLQSARYSKAVVKSDYSSMFVR
jgi:hypothetical protein